jgi:glycosyltransferase involved in cell wall biosynthesis
LRVLHIVGGNLTNGAAKGAYLLHKALREEGVESKIFTNSKVTFNDKDVISVGASKFGYVKSMIKAQIDVNIASIYKNREKRLFSAGFLGYDFTKLKEYKEADIIHLHRINSGLVNIKDLSKINKPVVWTIRDMWPMTGGCHYSECEKYERRCGSCPQLRSNFEYDLSRIVFNRKEKFYPKNMKIVGISNWISEVAKRSFLFKDYDVRTIFNNVNTNEFAPINKRVAKEILGIKSDKKVVLVGAQSLNDFYKGFDKFLEAIKYLKRKYLFLFFGNLDESILPDIEYKSFGFLYDTLSLRLLYSASDVFVAPSILEAFGKTLVEAMSSKTPVVCFDATGPRDIVEHKVSGYKAKPFSPKDLANGIDWLLGLSESEYQKICEAANNRAKKFDSKVIAKEYLKLYKELI